jgi:hypothetical protein
MTIDQSLGGGPILRENGLDQGKLPRPVGGAPLGGGYDVHELWYRLLLLRPWSCLAVVSPERTPKTLRLARSLAELGTQLRRRPIELVDGLQLDLERANAIAHLVEPASSQAPAEPRYIVALDSPIVNPVAIAVLAASDAVVLLLEKGITGIPQARRIVEIVGRERLAGAVLDIG